MRLSVGHQHSLFWPILVRFVYYYSLFWGPRAIFTIDDPQGVFACPASILIVLADSDRFMDYYSLFWCPEVISMVVESQGALTCRSSTLEVLADSGLFHGLLLTDLGSQGDFHGCRTPRCAYVLVVETSNLGRF